MSVNDKIYLKHILDAISKIGKYLSGVDYDEFIDDSMRSDAIVRELEVIGEATRNLGEQFKKRHHHIPWGEIAGMRNKLIHSSLLRYQCSQ